VVVRVLVPRPLRMASPVAGVAITEAAAGARRAVTTRVNARVGVKVKSPVARAYGAAGGLRPLRVLKCASKRGYRPGRLRESLRT
jgi:hypothetical protein